MQWSHHAIRALCAGPLLALVGCYSYNPYTPYGYGNQPGYYSGAPGTALPPAGSYAPNSSLGAPSGQMYSPPPTTYQGPQGTNGQWQPPNLSAPPPSQGSGAGSQYYDLDQNGSGSGKVPQPIEPPGGGFGDASGMRSIPLTGNVSPVYGRIDTKRDSNVALASAEVRSAPNPTDVTTNEEFLEPIPVQAADFSSDEASPANEPPQSPDPYDYDHGHYRWLRGVVRFDKQNHEWKINFSDQADDDDTYGGTLTLIDDDRLNGLRDSDVVVVEGRVDSRRIDASGKPSYRIEQIAPLVPNRD